MRFSVLCRSVGRGFLAAVCLTASLAGARADTELILRTANDLGVLLPGKDDLYTASLGVELGVGEIGFALEELMFTDREAGLRFDETYLTASYALPERSGWESRIEAGAVHVGNGIFGEEFQNFVHRLLNIEEVELDYIDEEETHPLLRVDVQRPFAATPELEVGPWIDLFEAFDFKRHAILGATLHWQASGKFSVFGNAAARYSETDLDALGPWTGGWGPQFEAGFGYGRFVRVSYSFNHYGAEEHHFHLSFHWTFD
jgi:hypothetical protein